LYFVGKSTSRATPIAGQRQRRGAQQEDWQLQGLNLQHLKKLLIFHVFRTAARAATETRRPSSTVARVPQTIEQKMEDRTVLIRQKIDVPPTIDPRIASSHLTTNQVASTATRVVRRLRPNRKMEVPQHPEMRRNAIVRRLLQMANSATSLIR
jgi:hypothetical protein